MHEQHFSLRAALVGCFLGSIICASNMYFGFKVGWSFGATIFAAIFGYPLMTSIVRITNGPKFNIYEHATLSSAATAAGGLTSAGFVNGLPAMYQMGIFDHTKIVDDFWRITLWGTTTAFFGIFFTMPLRKWFILKQSHLPFPSPTAAAACIKSFHVEGDKESGQKQFKMLLYTLVFGFAWVVIAYFVPYMRDLHINLYLSWWTAEWGPSFAGLSSAFEWLDTTMFVFTFSWAFFGAGMMMGPSTSGWFFFGQIFFWTILGKYLMDEGIVVSVTGLKHLDKPSIQLWLLWPGITAMIISSFTDLLLEVPGIIKSILDASKNRTTEPGKEKAAYFDDPAPPEHQVPTAWWLGGGIAATIYSAIVLKYYFYVGYGESILAIFLGFIMAFIGVQASAVTDINPVGTVAKISQFAFAAIPQDTKLITQSTSLTAAMVTAGSAAHASDLIGDLRVGHLVGASPRSQFLGQFFGSVFSVVTTVAFFYLMVLQYPCILDPDGAEECQKQNIPNTPAIAWRSITEALTSDDGLSKIPKSSIQCCYAFVVIIVICTILEKKVIPKKWAAFMPNWSSIGVALINTSASYATAMLFGTIASFVWEKRAPKSHELLMFSLASGLLAGEGIGGLFNSVFGLSGISEVPLPVSWGGSE